MPSQYYSERTIGKVIRSITADILDDFDKSVLIRLLSDATGKLGENEGKYKDWTFIISAFINDEEKKKQYLQFLNFVMRRRNIDPDKYEFWKLIMSIEIPIEFFKIFDDINTQIPRLSVRSRTKKEDKKKEKEEWYHGSN